MYWIPQLTIKARHSVGTEVNVVLLLNATIIISNRLFTILVMQLIMY